jgi:hypothetical protein
VGARPAQATNKLGAEESPDVDIPEPVFAIGQRVRVILSDRNRTPHEGTVRAAIWHYKERRFHYYLEEGGRKVSKRYTAEDLQPLG